MNRFLRFGIWMSVAGILMSIPVACSGASGGSPSIGMHRDLIIESGGGMIATVGSSSLKMAHSPPTT